MNPSHRFLLIFLLFPSFLFSQDLIWNFIGQFVDGNIPDSIYFDAACEFDDILVAETNLGLAFGFWQEDSSLIVYSSEESYWLRYPNCELEYWNHSSGTKLILIKVNLSYGRGYSHSAWSGSETTCYLINHDTRTLLAQFPFSSDYEEWAFHYEESEDTLDEVIEEEITDEEYYITSCLTNVEIDGDFLKIFPPLPDQKPSIDNEEVPDAFEFGPCEGPLSFGIYSFSPEKGLNLIRELR